MCSEARGNKWIDLTCQAMHLYKMTGQVKCLLSRIDFGKLFKVKQDSGQNRRRIMFLKESDELENITNSFTLSSIPFGMLEQHRGNIG